MAYPPEKIREYVEQDMTIAEIVNETGHSRHMIERACYKFGLRPIKKGERTRKKIQALADEGLTKREIAERLGMGYHTIKKYNIRTRINRTVFDDDREKKLRKLHSRGMSAAEIGRKIGLPGTTVNRKIHGLGLESNLIWLPRHDDLLRDAVEQCESWQAISKHVGKSVSSCRRHVEQLGLTFKSSYTASGRKPIKQLGLSQTIWGQIVRGAKIRNIPVLLSKADAWTMFQQQGKKCALTGVPITLDKGNKTASLDRIDPSGPYSIENCQWVHYMINQMKHVYTQQEILDMSLAIVKHNFDIAHEYHNAWESEQLQKIAKIT